MLPTPSAPNPRAANPSPQPAPSAPRSLWRNRDFVLLWAGQAVSTAGTQVSDLAMPLLVLALTGSPAQAGIVAAFGALPRFLLALPAGVLVDRWDRKRVMIVCDLARALALASIPVAFALGRLTMPQLDIVAFILGAGATLFFLARVSALPRVVSRTQLPAAVARNEAADSAVTLFGPPLGGGVFALSHALPFLADALSYAVSALSLGLIRIPFQAERDPNIAPPRFWPDMLSGLRWLWHAPLVRFMAFVYAGFALFNGGSSLAVIVLAQRRGASPLAIGLIFAAGGVGGLIGALVAARVNARHRFGRVLPILQWAYPLAFFLYAVAPTPLLMAFIEAGIMLNDQIYDVVWPSYRMALIPDALQGRVTSAYRLILSSMLPVGAATGGILVQRLGPAPALVVMGLGLAALALVVSLNPHVRHAPPIASFDPGL
ncbi:MAG TPA: MFS transporter [Ktedonobacterales bacterium]|nr:MFS transporter [Ktedonobacterales bacterium]